MVDAHDDNLDERVRSAYRETRSRDSAAEARLLRRLAESRPARSGWWFEPHLLELRPAPVVALAAVLLAVALWAGARFGTPAGHGSAATNDRAPAANEVANHDAANAAATARVSVTFMLRSSGAARVNLVGDFNSWDADATPLAHDGSRDLWIVELEVSRGMHNYAFVVDGREWRTDPSAPLAADATYGERTSVLVVEGAGL